MWLGLVILKTSAWNDGRPSRLKLIAASGCYLLTRASRGNNGGFTTLAPMEGWRQIFRPTDALSGLSLSLSLLLLSLATAFFLSFSSS